jgi:hypothetical protein
MLSFGCGREAPPPAATPAPKPALAAQRKPPGKKPATPRKDLSELLEPEPAEPVEKAEPSAPSEQASLLANIDERRVAAAGIRRLSSPHLVLYTDLPPGREIDELPEVFAQAFPAWCEFFSVDRSKHDDWQIIGCLMGDKAKFVRAGLLPESLPAFPNGYSVGRCFWLYDQTSPYYRRHLLLHEGTHAFMDTVLRAGGPPWYAEGLAELLGTHRWQDRRLELGVIPQSADEVPRLGRIEMIQRAFAAGKGLELAEVLAFGPRAHLEVEPYAWCWAAAALFDRSAGLHDSFRAIVAAADANRVPRSVQDLDPDGARQLAERWQMFVADLDYGYDFARLETDLTASDAAFLTAPTRVEVQADRGWQNTGLHLQGGSSYQLAAAGRFQIASEPAAANGEAEAWESEAGGVTLRYYRGQPLGMLLAAIRPDDFDPRKGLTPLAKPQPIGAGGEFTPPRSGTLFLKINDAPGELGDNAGSLKVEVAPAR